MDYSPRDCKELDRTEWLTLSLSVPHLPLMLCEICESGNCIMFLLSTLAPSTIPTLRRVFLFLLWVLGGMNYKLTANFSPVEGLLERC